MLTLSRVSAARGGLVYRVSSNRRQQGQIGDSKSLVRKRYILGSFMIRASKNLNFALGAPYVRAMNPRAAAYSSVATMAVAEMARELAVTPSFVLQECRRGKLARLPDGRISGLIFSGYLLRHRVEPKH